MNTIKVFVWGLLEKSGNGNKSIFPFLEQSQIIYKASFTSQTVSFIFTVGWMQNRTLWCGGVMGDSCLDFQLSLTWQTWYLMENTLWFWQANISCLGGKLLSDSLSQTTEGITLNIGTPMTIFWSFERALGNIRNSKKLSFLCNSLYCIAQQWRNSFK